MNTLLKLSPAQSLLLRTAADRLGGAAGRGGGV